MTLLTAQGIADVAIGLLIRSIVLPRTVTRIDAGEFRGGNGDTITVRVPQPAAARVQVNPGDAIVYDDIDEVPVDVTLRHLYNAKRLTDEEVQFDLEDFGRQILRPQVAAVAVGAEDEVAAEMNALAEDATIEFPLAADPDADLATFIAAWEQLGANGAPFGDRFAALSPSIAARLLAHPSLIKANEAGSDQALRRAILGNLFGFEIVISSALTAGTAVFYHRSGFAFANATPVAPVGLPGERVARSSEQGIGLRHLMDYDPNTLSDRSVVSTFAGAAAVWEDAAATDAKRFIKVGTAAV